MYIPGGTLHIPFRQHVRRIKTCLWLFWINLFIGAFTFGGGYIVVPMISKYYVRKKHLFSKEELLSMAAIAQSTPGAIAVNLSALAGHRTAGLPGVLASCLHAMVPGAFVASFVFHLHIAVILAVCCILSLWHVRITQERRSG